MSAMRLVEGTRSPRTKRVKPWWETKHRRRVSQEITQLILSGPLVIKDEERRFAYELWRKNAWSPRRWPTQYQWAQFFNVSLRTIVRWVEHLEAARMVKFERPFNIPDGNGGWMGPRKDQGSYILLPPTAWLYKNDWIYRGERQGWVTSEGEIVGFPPDVFSFPKDEPGAPGLPKGEEPSAAGPEGREADRA